MQLKVQYPPVQSGPLEQNPNLPPILHRGKLSVPQPTQRCCGVVRCCGPVRCCGGVWCCGAVEPRAVRCREVPGSFTCGVLGVLWSVVECCGVCWLVTSTSKKSPHLQKSHIDPQKVKKVKKSKKKSDFFFFGPFCYKNVEKMFYQPQKVIFSPQKVKKVKKIFFLFFHILCKKHTVFNHFWFLSPLPL